MIESLEVECGDSVSIISSSCFIPNAIDSKIALRNSSGLVLEVIPIIDEYPIMWTWLNRMHHHPLLIGYPFMYSKGDKNVAQRIGTMESDDLVETDSIFGQIIYWVGFWALFAFAPLTLLALLAMICTRIWKTRGNYKEPPFKFICQENKTKSD